MKIQTSFKGLISIDLFSHILCGYLLGATICFFYFKISIFNIPIVYHAYILIYVLALQIIRWLTTSLKVTSNGIQGSNIFGFNIYTAWDEIESVSPSKIFILPFLKISSAKSFWSVIYLPYKLEGNTEFINSISKMCLTNNQLKNYIE